jgi:hypothetical protein
MKYFSFISFFLLQIAICNAQKNIQTIVNQSKNKEELTKVLAHFSKPEDALKYKAACFLIENMSSHDAYNFYWTDSLNQKIEFDELAYSDLTSSINAFDALKTKHGKVHPTPTILNDVENIKADFLIDNIEQAFKVWQPQQYDFKTFCEYILPYRASIEPLQQWREKYNQKYAQLFDNQSNTIQEKIKTIAEENNKWFLCTYNIENRSEPLPRLGAMQLLHRKKGTCEDVAALTALTLRSIGIPATTDIVPLWATSTGGHTLNSTFDDKGKAIHFDVLSMDSLKEFVREPAKVFRTTFSIQENTLANQVAQEETPAFGLLQSKNYLDVTHEYWQTRDLHCKIYPPKAYDKVIYACVLNGGKWKPAWWGKAQKDSVTFTNLCKGAVFLPQIYENGKLIPVGYPVVSGYNKIVELKPETVTRSVTIKEQERYLKFRVGKTYKLMYYDKGWKTIAEQTATENTKELIFDNVPKNALLLLAPNQSEKKERPFVITDEGERLWW